MNSPVSRLRLVPVLLPNRLGLHLAALLARASRIRTRRGTVNHTDKKSPDAEARGQGLLPMTI
jgi:hypothetical protein